MFAIVRTGGKQYRVAADSRITVERLEGEPGSRVDLDVLMLGEGGEVRAATAPVVAEIVEHVRGEKIVIFKKRRRHNYRRKNGHRQHHTVLQIVSLEGGAPEKKAKAAGPRAKEPQPEPVEALVEASPAVAQEDESNGA